MSTNIFHDTTDSTNIFHDTWSDDGNILVDMSDIYLITFA